MEGDHFEDPRTRIDRLVAEAPGLEHLRIQVGDALITVTVFLRAGDAPTAFPMIAALRALLSPPHTVPGWILQPDSSHTA